MGVKMDLGGTGSECVKWVPCIKCQIINKKYCVGEKKSEKVK